MQQPNFTQYFELFEAVQKSSLFADSKTFADAVPLSSPEEISQKYQAQKNEPEFQLQTFVKSNFTLPEYAGGDVLRDAKGKLIPISEYIENSWTILTRTAIRINPYDTAIQLPSPYIVPGGRFREMFYWDSYFTGLGLIVSHRYDLLFALANNYRFLVEKYGYIPNGTRIYFLGRSQPPMYSLIIHAICRYVKPDYYQDHLTTLELEYQWWMQGENQVQENQAIQHVMNINGHIVNRYFDATPLPRPDVYHEEDGFLKGLTPAQKQKIYPHLRAGTESGWDFSARWFTDPTNIQTIHTSDFAPVDLNSILYLCERNLSKWYRQQKNETKAQEYAIRANKRNKAIRELMLNQSQNFYTDYILDQGKSDFLSLAGLYPVFAGIATAHEADAIFQTIEKQFLFPGGLTTTLIDSHEQWDYPNGWAPLQYIAYESCKRYGAYELAKKIKNNFCLAVEKMYDQTGTILEKYNVTEIDAKPQDGEYELQTGFGWTNGVYIWLKNDLL